MTYRSLLCLLMAGLTACSSAPPKYAWTDRGAPVRRDAPKAPLAPPVLESWGGDVEGPNAQDPIVAPGFLLTITSLADRKLNGEFRVDFDGNLQLPYDINVNAAGVNLSQLKKKLTGLYHPFFKSTPDIDLRIKERRYWIDVRGLVKTPGRVLSVQGASLDQVIILAGGADKETPPLFARIQKGTKNFMIDMNQYYGQGEDRPQILGWYGGEIVFLQREYSGPLGERLPSSQARLPIYMLGEVRKPGDYTVRPGSEFTDSLVDAGGFTDRADLDRIEIIRRTGGKRRSYEFSWNEFQRAPAPAPGDIILVHADRRKTELKLQIIMIFLTMLTSAAIIYELNRTNNINSQ